MALHIRRTITPKRGKTAYLGTTTTGKTVGLMKRVIWENYRSPAVLSLVNMVNALRSHYGLPLDLALCWTAYKIAYYEPDEATQTIRTPARVMDDNAANCVDYTVLICAVSLHFTQDVKFELAAYAPGDFTHVYPVIDGENIDVVPSQDQTGRERFTRGINFFPTFTQRNGKSITPVKTKNFKLWTYKF